MWHERTDILKIIQTTRERVQSSRAFMRHVKSSCQHSVEAILSSQKAMQSSEEFLRQNPNYFGFFSDPRIGERGLERN